MKNCKKEYTKDEYHQIILALQYYREYIKNDENLSAEQKTIYRFSNYNNLIITTKEK